MTTAENESDGSTFRILFAHTNCHLGEASMKVEPTKNKKTKKMKKTKETKAKTKKEPQRVHLEYFLLTQTAT